jgi:hypothetical protein
MGQSRTDLQAILEGISDNVYFQPPTDIELDYPCIIYRRDSDSSSFADNVRHRHKWRYEVTVIDRNPDSSLVESVVELKFCTFDRHFTTENLNHDVFHLFF